MATGGVGTLRRPDNLICPVCLDVFGDATMLSCGHTFCRNCLRGNDASHQDRGHMVCPICRKHTQLQRERVEGLPANVTVNGLVDDYRNSTGGLFASPNDIEKCTVCTVKGDAISFCKECNHYMCEDCHVGHQRMSSFFANHQVWYTARAIPMSDEIQHLRGNKRKHPTRPTIRVSKGVDLVGCISGMTAVAGKVLVCFINKMGIDKVDSKGNTALFKKNGRYFDLAHQSNIGNTVVSCHDNSRELGICSRNGGYMHTKRITNNTRRSPRITSNLNDELIIANRRNGIMIYDSSISTELRRIITRDTPWHAFETRSGAIIASTYDERKSSKVTAYDRSGRVGDTLTADPGKRLYAAVDSQDRVYVASVNEGADKVVITQYGMVGLEFKQVFRFEELTLSTIHPSSYMVCLPCDMIAFGSGGKLYFIKLHHL